MAAGQAALNGPQLRCLRLAPLNVPQPKLLSLAMAKGSMTIFPVRVDSLKAQCTYVISRIIATLLSIIVVCDMSFKCTLPHAGGTTGNPPPPSPSPYSLYTS